jgi:hypothetical protein
MARANCQEIPQLDLISYLCIPQLHLYHSVSNSDEDTNPSPANQYESTVILDQDLPTSFSRILRCTAHALIV